MDKIQIFRFTNEELKKINQMVPKGYKFIPKDQLNNKNAAQKHYKKNSIPQITVIPPVQQHFPPKLKIEKIKEQYIEPKSKVNYIAPLPAAPQILPNDQPAVTCIKFLEKVKRYEIYDSLMSISKAKQTQISLQQIEKKVMSLGQSYKISDFGSDLTNFCHMLYIKYPKASIEYREAAQLQNYLVKLMAIENDRNRRNSAFNLNNSLSLPSNNQKKRLPINNRTTYQPLSQNKLATPSEKRLLGQMIKKLPSESLQQVCYIIFQSTQNRQYIFDLDTLHVKKFRQIQQYVKKCMQKTGEWQQRNFQDQQFSNQSIFVIQDDAD